MVPVWPGASSFTLLLTSPLPEGLAEQPWVMSPTGTMGRVQAWGQGGGL